MKAAIVLMVVLAACCWGAATKPTPLNTESPATRTVSTDVTVQHLHLSAGISEESERPGSLDDVPCEHVFTQLEGTSAQEIALDSGLAIGFNVSRTFCPECVGTGPFRIESLTMRVHRPDGSAADTLDLLISVYCPADEQDACAGAGTLRRAHGHEIVFADDPLDGVDEIRTITVPVAVVSDRDNALVVIESFGMRAGAVPLVGLSDASSSPVVGCSVWIGHGVLEPWTTGFSDPVPGAPMSSVLFSCDLDDTAEVDPCADLCAFSRFSGEPVYFDPFTTVAYQWAGASDVQFPVRMNQVNLSLFFEQLGNASDAAYVRLVAACPTFGDACCPPGDVIFDMPISVVRGTPFQTVLDITMNLGTSTPVLNGPFWIGAVIDSVTGQAALPSFLFSSASQLPPPVACEQWCGVPGRLSDERSDDLGWAKLSFTAVCNAMTGQPAPPCAATATTLACETASELLCSERGELTPSQVISPGLGVTDRYCCSDLQYFGQKRVYRLTVPEQTNLLIELYEESSVPLTLFLLSACDQQSCIASAQGSLTITGLAGQDYFVVVESSDTLGHEFDLFVQCYGDCIGELCVTDVRGAGGIGNRYLDGEGNGNGDALYYSYYPGFGNTQTILRFGSACETLPAIEWQSLENSASRMLAYDPRNGGEYWCGTTLDYFAGTGRMYRISSGGGVVQSWNFIAGLPILRWSGAAFDAVHNHLWVMIRDSLNLGNARAFELDLSDPLQPIVIQGPHVLTVESPNSVVSSGGADYADSTSRLVVMFQGTPDDFVQCFDDIDPSYAGPPPGPGLTATEWCVPDSNSVQGYGLAALEIAGGGEIAMMNFTDSDWQHPLLRYPSPCRLVPFRCVPPSDVSIAVNGATLELRWTAVEPGVYEIYSSLTPGNDGNPDGGQDTLFHLEAALTLPAGPVYWPDLDLASTYKTYSVILNCPVGVGQNSPSGQRRESESRKEENGHED